MGIIERKEREKEARRSLILDAAEQVFQKKGIGLSTMDDIAQEAELAKGTIYLYYRNKDELQLGVMLRAMDIVHQSFAEAAEKENLALKKFQAVGEAYWKFSIDEPFRFRLICNGDFPLRENISEEMILELNNRSNWVWQLLIGIIEEGKREGTIKPEVESFSLSMLAWLNTMSILRLYQKVQENTAKGAAIIAKQAFNICAMDFQKVYELSITTLLSHAVTEEGAKFLAPVRFPSMEELGVSPAPVQSEVKPEQENIESILA
ncbi:MAG: TetR/AcrR family transcriptional regulator [bacterium]